MKTKFHCISDLHLDAVTYGVPRHREICSALSFACSFVEEGDILVNLGDVADPGTNRSYGAVAQLIALDREVHGFDARRVIHINGNHDVLEDGSGGSVLAPLDAAGGEVIFEPTLIKGFLDHPDTWLCFLPHASLARKYDPGEFLSAVMQAFHSEDKRTHMAIFGHLNPPGITPGSEATKMPRGREVMWPELVPDDRIFVATGHIHRAQIYRGMYVIGSPVRFDVSEADHVPQTLTAEFYGARWFVERREIPDLKRFVLVDGGRLEDFEIREGDFVRAIDDEETAKKVAELGAVFIPIPKVAAAVPKAEIGRGARKHRRVRDVVRAIAESYPTAKDGALVERVEETMTEAGL